MRTLHDTSDNAIDGRATSLLEENAMRGVMRTCIVCVGVACTATAAAAPAANPREKYQLAKQLDQSGEPEKALAAIDEGLAAAPRDLALLDLKGTILLNVREYTGALAAYQALLDAGATGFKRRQAEKIVHDLSAVRSTSLELDVSGGVGDGPTTIFLDTKTFGAFCTAAPSCTRPLLPGDYKVIAERSGFERWTERVTVEKGKTTKLDVALAEKPSQLTVRVTPADAQVRVGDEEYRAPMTVLAGKHPVSAHLAGYLDAHLEAIAHEGKPIELAVTLTPLVPLRVEPAGATLQLDNGPPVVQDGGIALPPGAHVVVGRARDYTDRRVEVPAERPEGYKLDVVLERIVPPPPPPPPPPLPMRRKIAIGAAGVSVVSLIVGGFLWDDADRYDANLDRLCPPSAGPCPDKDVDEAQRLRDGAAWRRDAEYASFAVGAGAAIAAAVLWVTGAPESRVAVTPRVGPVAGLDVTVRF
jgi:hypothetical protein